MTLIIPGKPHSQPRHRHSTRNGKTITYNTNTDQKAYVKAYITAQIRQNYGFKFKPFADVPLKVGFQFVYKLPKSKRKLAKTTNNNIPHTVKPDIDNLQKFYLDAMSSIVYVDDNLVYCVEAAKYYSANNIEQTIITVIPNI